MELATSALSTLLPKLANLQHGEYKLERSVRENIDFLVKEMETWQAALRSIHEVPLEQRHELPQMWASQVRELSYHIEDVVDTFIVTVEGSNPQRRFIRKMKFVLAMGKRHQFGEQIKLLKYRVVEVAERRLRYMVYDYNPAVATVGPHIANLYANAREIVGINKAKEELVMKLTKEKIVSIVGFAGIGKTTLAKAVYDEIKVQFDCTAFLTVSRNPDMKKFLKDMLYEFDRVLYGEIRRRYLDIEQLIDTVRQYLHDKRYLIIIDDIRHTSHWDLIIKHALPDNNTGCRIITTTRKVTIAKHIGLAYDMQPLSPESSRVLLYKRLFGTEDQENCLDEELVELSNRILRKCAGVPLAINTVASLLATRGKNKTEWGKVCNSIGHGMENNLDIENMKNILSYSYYDLPSYLRNCLLYLTMFPEDYEIEKDRLIWLWIAEGFIQPKRLWRMSPFGLGESYFDELIYRSMIQPVSYYLCTEIMSCRIDDMMLDLIHSITSEENFVTILRNVDETPPSTMECRLSLQNGKTDHAKIQESRSMLLVRSVIVFPSAMDQMPALRSFRDLCVLDLQGCDLSQGCNLQYLGSLFLLKYLSLKYTRIDELPEAVGNLHFLEILDVRYTSICQLPKCVAQLTYLLCLSVSWSMRISSRIGNLTSLEHLTCLRIDDESADIVQDLGFLTDLRVLSIMLFTDKWTDMLVKSLCKLQKIQSLSIDLNFEGHFNLGVVLDQWVLCPRLRTLDTGHVWFSMLPAWMNNPAQHQNLVYLHIAIRDLQQEDLKILGRMPALHTLKLYVGHKDLGIVGRRFVVGAQLYPCLVRCMLWGFVWPVKFQQGAMPRLRDLDFELHVLKGREIVGSDGGYGCGLRNLQSLQLVSVLVYGATSEVEFQEVKVAVRREAETHPNHPRLDLRFR